MSTESTEDHRSYTVGLPVVVSVHDSGRVTAWVDTGEANDLEIYRDEDESDESFAAREAQMEADGATVERSHIEVLPSTWYPEGEERPHPYRVTRALYDALQVLVSYHGDRIANEGDRMAIQQAKAAIAAYDLAHPGGLLPEVDASRVLAPEGIHRLPGDVLDA